MIEKHFIPHASKAGATFRCLDMEAYLRKRKVLMIPGPTEVSFSVLAAMSRPVMAHYGPEWTPIITETTDMLKKVFQTKNDVFIMPGSGTLSMETSVVSLFEHGDKVFSIISGFFGKRFRDLASSHGAKVVEHQVAFGEPIEPDVVDRKLAQEKDVKAITVIHNETSSGTIAPIKQLGEIARKHDALLIVDSISSLGGLDLRTDEWNVDVNASASQKCIGVPPGLSLIAVGERAWEFMKRRKSPIPGIYMNLSKWREAAKKASSPVTTPSSLILGLRASLIEILEEGLEKRFSRHAVAGRAVREGVKAMGLQLFATKEKYASNTVTVIKTPPRIDDAKLREIMSEKHGIMIGGGLGELEGKTFRIGHMANTASRTYVMPTLSALESALADLGFKLEAGKGVTAAHKAFE